jgi:hypothetical protein
MKVTRSDNDRICIDFSGAEARAFLDELSDVPGGSRLPKLRQVCSGLEGALATADMAFRNARQEVIGQKAREVERRRCRMKLV